MERVTCNLCGSEKQTEVRRKWNYCIVQCDVCGLVFVNPREFASETDDYFQGPYLSTIEQNGELDPGIAYLYNQAMTHIGSRIQPGRLLDVGCAMGHLLEFARARGWQVEGVECSVYACEYARRRFGVKVYTACDLREAGLTDDAYDACTLIEVIEHLPDPRMTMLETFRALRPDGVLYVTTPNFRSYRSILLAEEWAAVIPRGHLYYFERGSLAALLADVGFDRIEDLTPSIPFAHELAFASEKGIRIPAEEVARLAAAAEKEDYTVNGRSEGLVMCARKPAGATGPSRATASRQRFMSADFEGQLVRRPGDSVEDGKVYFVENGWRRWVISQDWIIKKGLRWPEDVRFITAEELNRLPLGPPLT